MERDMPVLSFQWTLVVELVMQLYLESNSVSSTVQVETYYLADFFL